MKKLVAFAMILSLGMFCAVGCGEKKDTNKKDTKTTTGSTTTTTPSTTATPPKDAK